MLTDVSDVWRESWPEWGKLLTKSSREIEPMRHNVKGLEVDLDEDILVS